MSWHEERIIDLLEKILEELKNIRKELAPVHLEPESLAVHFGIPVPNSIEENNMGSTPFTAPNIDMVPYDVVALDSTGTPVSLVPTQVLALVSADANAIVVPNSTDPTGATGNIVAAKGFSGAVGGSATLTDSANPGFSLSGTWSGTFVAGVTEPVSLSIQFGTPAPATSAKRK